MEELKYQNCEQYVLDEYLKAKEENIKLKKEYDNLKTSIIALIKNSNLDIGYSGDITIRSAYIDPTGEGVRFVVRDEKERNLITNLISNCRKELKEMVKSEW